MCRDEPVLSFTYDTVSRLVTWMSRVYDATLVPVGLKDASGAVSCFRVADWVYRRAVPSTRPRLQRVLSELGIDSTDQLMFLGTGAGLTDSFWFRAEGQALSWHEVNFFENDFDERLGIALIPHDSSSGEKALRSLARSSAELVSSSSPDPAIGGELPKRWTILADGTRALIKGGHPGHLWQEPFNELVASELCGRILDRGEFVSYDLDLGDAGAVSATSTCPAFTSYDLEFATAEHVYGASHRDNSLSRFDNYVSALARRGIMKARQSVEEMVVIDFIMANFDRHWGNFGVLIDTTSREWVSAAPIFDTGNSLWCDLWHSNGLPDTHRKLPMPFLTRPERQLKFLRDLSWFDPDRLEGFADAACETLSKNKVLVSALPDRVDAIHEELSRRIGILTNLQRNLEPVRVQARSLEATWEHLLSRSCRSVAKARNPSLEESTPRPSAARQAEGQHKRGDAVR